MGRVAIEPATMTDRVVVQWDKEGLEEAGLVKIDILGLRMLSAISEAVQLVETITGTRPALNQLAFDDPAVYAMISQVIWRKSQVNFDKKNQSPVETESPVR